MMPRADLRLAFVRRFPLLRALLAPPRVRRLWCAALWCFWLIYFGFVVLILALRYSVLPRIEDYRSDIERLVSQGLGQSVSIGRIEASWDGLNPDLTLLDVHVADKDGRPALAFSRVEAVLSWWSVPSGQLKLSLLRIDEPQLHLRRDVEGRIFVAGIPLSQEGDDKDISGWILGLRRIRIRGATLVWDDEFRHAPSLVLEDVNLALDNDWRRHRFGLTAQPPENLASRIDVRGDFWGADIDQVASWDGTVFAEIDYTDLAVWRQWIDYPFDLPHGRGALRSWLDFADGRLREITADVSLRDVSLRLARELPSLELDYMSGRLGASFASPEFSVQGRGVELLTRAESSFKGETGQAIRIAPTDFRVEWQPEVDGSKGAGSARANRLDLLALSRLAEHLPFDVGSRQLLKDYAPRGTIQGLSAKWQGDADHLQNYALKADFSDLALRAQGYFPGFSGLSGSLEASDQGGRASLRSQASSIDLPSVFPESLTRFDALKAQAKWKISKDGLEAELSQVEFSGRDAAGSAQGTYRNSGEGPGSIDLTASLSRGDARAVWRYMPHAVGAGARHWLRDSLLAGHSSEAKLILKGDLADFPFVDKRTGQFLVTVKAHDVLLDYAKGWPRIDGIDGNLRFEGNGMIVEAQRGSILGASLSKLHAEIPDFDKPISTLLVKGQADGATAEFLKFIDQSPVAARIDHFTEDMRASGNGHLDLSLVIPLDETRLGNSKIDGSYRFMNNEVTVDAALPPIKQVNGTVQFSGRDLRIPEINGILFGGPLKIKGGLQKDGKVLISANGTLSVEQMRKQSASPILASLSGSTPYRGEVRINKRNADLVVDSTLVGLGSVLPEPFKKSVGESLPLRFEKKFLPQAFARKGDKPGKPEAVVRDRLAASLGNILSLQLIRQKQAGGFAVERGALAIGQSLPLPEAGVALGVTARRIDLDFWRRALQVSDGVEPGGGEVAATPSFMPASITLKTPDLLLFGRHLNDVDVVVSAQPAQWKIRLNSRQANGDLQWETAGSGKLSARLKQLTIETSDPSVDAETSDAIKELPALDIVADEFLLGARRFGRLELQARNEGGLWRLNKVQMSNPYGTLAGSGQWLTSAGRNQTQLDFRVDSSDVGKLLDRLGYLGAVSAATARLDGKLNWKGSPTAFDFASLNGEMNLQAGKGQFVKLDPGAAGKLLGLISLQSLPRRITLDFKDVFSEGFSFDSIASKVVVRNGVMRTDRLQIDGTSAHVMMRGEVDLKQETQRLTVNVQPEVGSTAALGIALVNPIAGVASLLAHKVLQNPLNQMFGYDYLVTGTWDDPKVTKLSGSAPPVVAPSSPDLTSPPPGAGDDSSAK